MMNIDEILEYLPHRYPFLLVDRVTEVEKGKSIKGYKNISFNESFFQGHFPNNPIMPGVLIIEAMAQLSGILGFVTVGRKPSDGVVQYLAGSSKARFKRPVLPGDGTIPRRIQQGPVQTPGFTRGPTVYGVGTHLR